MYNCEDSQKTAYSYRKVKNMIYTSNTEEIDLVDCAVTTIKKTVKNDPSFNVYKLFFLKGNALITGPIHTKLSP